MHDDGASYYDIAHSRFEVVDFELRGYDSWTKHAAADKCQSIVCGIAQYATVDEAVLLQQFRPHWDYEFNATRREI